MSSTALSAHSHRPREMELDTAAVSGRADTADTAADMDEHDREERWEGGREGREKGGRVWKW